MNEQIEKQAIEEMAQDMVRTENTEVANTLSLLFVRIAEALYNKSYRKQSDSEWILIQDGKGVCSACHRQDAVDRHAHFCRYCGAHMRGGAE